MKFLITLLLLLSFSSTVMAQKTYVDPNVKAKKGLLEPGQIPEPAKPVETLTPDTTPVAMPAIVETKKVDPKVAQYCACYNLKFLSSKKMKLVDGFWNENKIESKEYGMHHDRDERIQKLVNRFALDFDSSKIECENIEVEGRILREYDNAINGLDKTCKLSEIERKAY